ncbi:DUF4825 domain-containing protein [Niallia sp. Krafla_26]|uniref:DUF4825 domain-containing protein n=1 Tax=Niallia sp. Krafla_26 TaxID=3064703 RepID=UPI003D1658BC
MIQLFFFSFLFLVLLNGCQFNNEKEDLFEFKDSFVGDNSSIGSIINQLPSGEYVKGFKLETNDEPYGIIINYEGIEAEEIEKTYKETAIYNASFIFALVQNAEWVTFRFDHKEYKLKKEELQNWYGEELRNFTSEDELRKLTQEYLKDENKVNEFFK